MSDWDDFLDSGNFHLAWERVLRAREASNKDRMGLQVYAADLEVHLQELIAALRGGSYRPSPAERIYKAKRSGSVREMPVLSVADRLVYQAVANIVGRNSAARFEAIARGHVYAHLLAPSQSRFMLRKWHGPGGQYRRFLNRYRGLHQQGCRWVAEADIASYYDSLGHEALFSALRRDYVDDDRLTRLLGDCLGTWSAQGGTSPRGLPAGYEASDFLSTLFLLPIDEQMAQYDGYLRYVDDVRVLAPEKETVSRGLISLDIALGKLGLALQPAKTGVRQVTAAEREMDHLAGTLSMMDWRRGSGQSVHREAEELFASSWHALGQDEHAEAHLIFALNRLQPGEATKEIALKMLHDMPWRSDQVTAYLAEFVGDDEVTAALADEIGAHRVYGWHIANCFYALARVCAPDRYRRLAQKTIAGRALPWVQRLAAAESLQGDAESHDFLRSAFDSEPNHLVRRGLLAAATLAAETDDQRAVVLHAGLGDGHPEVAAAAAWLLDEFPRCRANIGALVPAGRSMPAAGDSPLEGYLVDGFAVGIPAGLHLRRVFGSDYQQAAEYLGRAARHLQTNPDVVVAALDDFNRLVAAKALQRVGHSPLPGERYGAEVLPALKAGYGSMSAAFAACHALHSQIREPQRLAIGLGAWSPAISHRRKDRLLRKLRGAYQQFVDAFAGQQAAAA